MCLFFFWNSGIVLDNSIPSHERTIVPQEQRPALTVSEKWKADKLTNWQRYKLTNEQMDKLKNWKYKGEKYQQIDKLKYITIENSKNWQTLKL